MGDRRQGHLCFHQQGLNEEHTGAGGQVSQQGDHRSGRSSVHTDLLFNKCSAQVLHEAQQAANAGEGRKICHLGYTLRAVCHFSLESFQFHLFVKKQNISASFASLGNKRFQLCEARTGTCGDEFHAALE